MFSLQPCFLAVLLILSQVSPAISISIVADEVPESSAVSLLQAEAQIRKNAAAAVAAAAATKSAVLNSPPTSPAKGSLSDFNTEACDLATLGPASAKHFEDFSDVPPLRAASDTRFADAASSSPTQASVVSSSSSDDEDDDDDDEPVDPSDEEEGEYESAEELRQSAMFYLLEVGVVFALLSLLKSRSSRPQNSDATAAASHEAAARTLSEEASKEALQQFMTATIAGDTAAAQALLEHPFNHCEVDAWGCTALHAAAKQGALALVQRLLELRPPTLEALDSWDETPLHLAARAGHQDVCEELILEGASLEARNAEDQSPLVVAALAQQTAICRFLIAHGAVVDESDADTPSLLKRILAEKREQQDGKASE